MSELRIRSYRTGTLILLSIPDGKSSHQHVVIDQGSERSDRGVADLSHELAESRLALLVAIQAPRSPVTLGLRGGVGATWRPVDYVRGSQPNLPSMLAKLGLASTPLPIPQRELVPFPDHVVPVTRYPRARLFDKTPAKDVEAKLRAAIPPAPAITHHLSFGWNGRALLVATELQAVLDGAALGISVPSEHWIDYFIDGGAK